MTAIKNDNSVFTRQQWLKKGYCVNPDAGGVFYYPSSMACSRGKNGILQYFSESEVSYDPENARIALSVIRRGFYERSKIKIREAKEKAEKEKIEREIAEKRKYADFWYNSYTAWQWINDYGRVPVPYAEWQLGPNDHEGNWLFGKTPHYYYCNFDYTVENSELAKKLLFHYDKIMTGVELPPPGDMYDGRPWWSDDFFAGCDHVFYKNGVVLMQDKSDSEIIEEMLNLKDAVINGQDKISLDGTLIECKKKLSRCELNMFCNRFYFLQNALCAGKSDVYDFLKSHNVYDLWC